MQMPNGECCSPASVMAGSEAVNHHLRNGKLYTWQYPGTPVRIGLPLDVVERLGAEVRQNLESGPPLEVGGILIGRSEVDAAGVITTVITDFEQVDCEHGPESVYVPCRNLFERAIGIRPGSV